MDTATLALRSLLSQAGRAAQPFITEAVTGFSSDQQVPLVAGTPSTTDPALGWLASVSVADGWIDAKVTLSDPATKAKIEGRADKRFFLSLFDPAAPSNPVPGKWSIKHISLPMKKDAQFADSIAFAAFDVEFAADRSGPPLSVPAGHTVDPEDMAAFEQWAAGQKGKP